jgi:WD40 repeat protein
LIYASTIDCFYSASTDGTVRSWQGSRMRGSASPVHACAEWIYSMVFLARTSRLLILQADGAVCFYNCSTTPTSVEHEPYRCYATLGHSAQIAANGQPEMMTKKRREVFLPPPTSNVTLMEPAQSMMCAEHVASQGNAEIVAFGCQGGNIDIFALHGSEKPLRPTARLNPHRSHQITQLMMAPALGGLLSSAFDGTVRLYDIEQEHQLQCLVTPATTTTARAAAKRKPVMGFDYLSHTHNLLCFGSGRRVYVWSAFNGVLLSALPDHDD